MTEANIVKMFSTSKFEIGLYELPSGEYCVAYSVRGKDTVSEAVNDYHMASYLFDIKLTELEGH